MTAKAVGMENQFMKKIAAALLCVLMLALTLCACSRPGDDATTTTPSTTEPPTPDTEILFSDLENYTIIRPENASSELINKIVDFNKTMQSLNNGDYIKIKDDFVKEGIASLQPTEYEIIIGNTKRDETAAYKADLRYFDYGFTVIGKKIVILGYTDETVELAMNLFVDAVKENVNKNDGTDLFISSAQQKKVDGTYSVDTLKIGENDIKSFTVVYPKSDEYGEKDKAEDLALSLSLFSGYEIIATDDRSFEHKDGSCEILIGNTNRTTSAPSDLAWNESYVAVDKNTVLLAGGGFLGIQNAVSDFAEMITAKTEKNVVFNLASPARRTDNSETLKVMSFNLKVASKTAERDARVIKIIKDYLPDVLGVQEASPAWMSTLRSNLSAYAYVGLGRDGGSSGEHSAIFYLKEKFTLVEQGTKWLSDTPDVVSKYSESSLNRIYTYAVLKRNSDGKIFVHVNTHLDHTSDAARAKQAQALIKGISELTKKYPTILTGDFNATADTTPIKTILAANFNNSSVIADKKHGSGTFHGYSGKNSIIDFCFVTKGNVSVQNYRVCDEKIAGDYPSDHYPVYLEMKIS